MSRANQYPHRRSRNSHGQQGLSLTELMVALVISTLILIALVQVFINSRTIYKTDEGLARIQENGRFAMEFLERDIRMAGSMGCLGDIANAASGKQIDMYLNGVTGSAVFDIATRGGIEGFDATTTGTGSGTTFSLPTLYPASVVTATQPALIPTLVPGMVAGSDILVLRGMDSGGVKLIPPYTDGAQLFAEEPNDFQAGDILIVTDCERAAVFQATTASSGGGSTTISHGVAGGGGAGAGGGGSTPGNYCANWGSPGCPGHNFKGGSGIAKFSIVAYYIGPGTYGGPSLFRRTWTSGTAVDLELVEGVENMQVLYGLDADQNDNGLDNGSRAQRYVPANEVGNWSQVVAIRVALLIAGTTSANQAAGTSEAAVDASTYGVAGVTITPPANDRHMRRVFTTTVKVRNR